METFDIKTEEYLTLQPNDYQNILSDLNEKNVLKPTDNRYSKNSTNNTDSDNNNQHENQDNSITDLQTNLDDNEQSQSGYASSVENILESITHDLADEIITKKGKRTKQKRESRKNAAFYTQLSEEERQLRGRELMNARSREYRKRQKAKSMVLEKVHTEEEQRNKQLVNNLNKFDGHIEKLEFAVKKLNNIVINSLDYNEV